MVQVRQVQSGSWHKRKNLQINYYHRLWHKLFSIFSLQPQLMFTGMRVMRPSRKEISSMLFTFTQKELKWNCNEKELRAKLYNNRAIAHSKLGKMMRALICIFFLFWSYWVVSSSFLKKVIILNACPEKFTSYLGLSNIQRSNLLPQISMSITSFSQNYSNGSWFATCMANHRYLFQ